MSKPFPTDVSYSCEDTIYDATETMRRTIARLEAETREHGPDMLTLSNDIEVLLHEVAKLAGVLTAGLA